MTRFDVVVLGELNVDLIVRGDVVPRWAQAEQLLDDATLTLGSSAAIMASGCARLGLRTAFIGLVGADLFGALCGDHLAARGIDIGGVTVAPDLRTGCTIVLQRDADRTMLTFPGAMAHFGRAHVAADAFCGVRHVHLASPFLQPALRPAIAGVLASARAAGATTSLDPNWDPAGRWDDVPDWLPQLDIFLPNDAEACAIVRAHHDADATLEDAIAWLAARVPLLAVKCGAAGAIARRGAQHVHRAPPAVVPVDAVGAGDSFDAGLLYGYLAGWPLEQILHAAVVCGALSTRAAGGTAAQATRAEMSAALDDRAG